MSELVPFHPYGISYDGIPFAGRQPRWMTLANLINERGFRDVAEIGVEYGLTTFKILEHCSLDVYFLVDPGFQKSCYDGVFPIESRECHRPSVCMQMSSVDAAKYIAPRSLDLVYIDAMHTYDNVKEDSLCWLSKIREGGIICGHDYCPFSTGVEYAVKELYKDFILIDDNSHDVLTDAFWVQSAVWIVEVPGGLRDEVRGSYDMV